MQPKALLMCRNRQSLRLMVSALDKAEMAFDSCDSAQEAIELIVRGRYSALVLDYDLPGAGQVAKLARLAPPEARSVVFAMMGNSTTIATGFQSGANFVLSKPLAKDRVVRALRAARGFMRTDRRRSERHTVNTVVYLLFGKKVAIPTLMVDLNQDGLSIQAAEPLPAVQEVPVHFLLPGTSHPVEGTAEVIWADDGGRAGMFFTDLTPPAQKHLKTWLKRRDKKKVVVPSPTASHKRAAHRAVTS